MLDHCRTRPGRYNHDFGVLEDFQQPVPDLLGFSVVSEVERRLPTACLARVEANLQPQSLQQSNRGDSYFREDLIDQAGGKNGYFHVLSRRDKTAGHSGHNDIQFKSVFWVCKILTHVEWHVAPCCNGGDG